MPYTSQQRKGHRAELDLKHDLEARGYTVIKAAGSKGPFDLVAWSEKEVLLLQVKCNGWPGAKEAAKIRAQPVPPHGKVYAVRRNDYQRTFEWKEYTCNPI